MKLLGGGFEESLFAYKDINEVMQSQRSLVDVVGKFTPEIVKMDGATHRTQGGKMETGKLKVNKKQSKFPVLSGE